MSQYNPHENILVYTELKSNDIWQQYIEIFGECGREKDLIELINSAFEYYYQNDSISQVTKKV